MSTLLPQVFRDFIQQAGDIDALSEEVVSEYCQLIGEDMSFIPELMNIVGPSTFRDLVHRHGGLRFTLPTADDIVARVKAARRANAKS